MEEAIKRLAKALNDLRLIHGLSQLSIEIGVRADDVTLMPTFSSRRGILRDKKPILLHTFKKVILDGYSRQDQNEVINLAVRVIRKELDEAEEAG